MILVSTGGFKGTSAYKTALKFIENGINCIELSGGAYETVEFWKYQELSEIANLKIHNYFPPPEVPFVFNLASKDPVIAEKVFYTLEMQLGFPQVLVDRSIVFMRAFF